MHCPDVPRVKRCAIYTRKSSNHLLDREINSLEAQREICSAYVKSQQHKGWVELPRRYDDGGHSGTDAQRPALSGLMQDIEAGLVDVVVIYKIDRLTRSLLDFVRLMEIFDRHAIPFVSITQSFDTSDSLGRMILNILLTFSQFERELIAERVRDNVRARQRHGKWAGGLPPFGYELTGDGLEVIEEEAEVVRFLFQQFLKLGTYRAVKKVVGEAGLRSTQKLTRKGLPRGGGLISSGAVYKILNNPVYLGDIRCDGQLYPGRHEAIISRDTWNAAQAVSTARARPVPGAKRTGHFLAGLLWDSLGRRMILSNEQDRGRAYCYYVSSNANWSRREGRKQFRSHATKLDALVLAAVADFLSDREKLRAALQAAGIFGQELETLTVTGARSAALLETCSVGVLPQIVPALIELIEVGKEHLAITFRVIELRRFLLWKGTFPFHGRPSDWTWSGGRYVLKVPVRAVSAERSPVIPITPRDPRDRSVPDSGLVELLRSARSAQGLLEQERDRTLEDLARKMDCRPSHFSRLVRLNYLAPDIVTSIIDGTQPPSLTRRELLSAEIPLDWALQRRLLGFPASEREPRERALSSHDELHNARGP